MAIFQGFDNQLASFIERDSARAQNPKTSEFLLGFKKDYSESDKNILILYYSSNVSCSMQRKPAGKGSLAHSASEVHLDLLETDLMSVLGFLKGKDTNQDLYIHEVDNGKRRAFTTLKSIIGSSFIFGPESVCFLSLQFVAFSLTTVLESPNSTTTGKISYGTVQENENRPRIGEF